MDHGLSVNEVNSFNANTKVGKLYINDKNKLIFYYFVNLEHGVLPENLKSSFEWFIAGMHDLVRIVNADKKSSGKIKSLIDRLKERFRK
ncbi:MAG: YbjN domain-containing protein [Desulfovibrio sp.]|nr:YbjN domain-containing protein [Desulfovibrio sp.]